MNEKLKRALAEGRAVGVKPLAHAAGVTPNAIYAAVRNKEIRAIIIGAAIRIPPNEVRRLLGLDPASAA